MRETHQDIPPLVVESVVKTYRSRRRSEPPVTAVDGVSFTIAPGAAATPPAPSTPALRVLLTPCSDSHRIGERSPRPARGW